jgi:glycosyltransferase involved in cell wall biosynthesis
MAEPSRRTIWVYGATDATRLSGSPFYFSQALAQGVEGSSRWAVRNVPIIGMREAPFALARWTLSTGLPPRFFNLSQAYHDASFALAGSHPEPGDIVISFTQVVPQALRAPGIVHAAYADATYSQYLTNFLALSDGLRQRLLQHVLPAEKAQVAATSVFFVYTDDTKRSLVEEYGAPADQVVVAGRGANLERSPPPRPLGDTREQLRLMLVGRDFARKGGHALIRAMDMLSERERRRVILVVAGPEASTLPRREYISPLGFVGPECRPKLLNEMAAADLGVLMSSAEGLPGSVWEFLSVGTPVWATRLPGMEEALGGRAAVLEDLPVAVERLAARLRGWLTDRADLERLRTQALQTRTGLGWDRPAALVVETLEKAASGRSSPVASALRQGAG